MDVEKVLELYENVWSRGAVRQQLKDKRGPIYDVLVQDFGIERHFEKVDSHKRFLAAAYERLRDNFPLVTMEHIREHDMSKYGPDEAIGYTARWIHNTPCPAYDRALSHHYAVEDHHPEHHGGYDMYERCIQESVLDMIACRWERTLNGVENVSVAELTAIPGEFLERYTPRNRRRVEELLSNIWCTTPPDMIVELYKAFNGYPAEFRGDEILKTPKLSGSTPVRGPATLDLFRRLSPESDWWTPVARLLTADELVTLVPPPESAFEDRLFWKLGELDIDEDSFIHFTSKVDTQRRDRRRCSNGEYDTTDGLMRFALHFVDKDNPPLAEWTIARLVDLLYAMDDFLEVVGAMQRRKVRLEEETLLKCRDAENPVFPNLTDDYALWMWGEEETRLAGMRDIVAAYKAFVNPKLRPEIYVALTHREDEKGVVILKDIHHEVGQRTEMADYWHDVTYSIEMGIIGGGCTRVHVS